MSNKIEKRSLLKIDDAGRGRGKGSFSSFSSIQVKPFTPLSPEKELIRQERLIEIGCVSQEGLYHENEDRMSHGVDLTMAIDGFVGVFDGHGGQDCANFVSTKLQNYLELHFSKDADWIAGDTRMKEMFHCIEADFMNVAQEEEDTSGACATVVLVKGKEALIANIGDCRVVAVPDINDSTNSYEVVTDDHRADAPSESDRIIRAGGSVVDGRVFNLQPSRSFGDLDVKDLAGEGVVIPTPEVGRVQLKEDGFLIVATDGLWDSVFTEAAVDVAKEVLIASSFDAEQAAEALVDLALENRATDDVTVSIVVWHRAKDTDEAED